MNILGQVFLWTDVSICFRNTIAGSVDRGMFNFVRNPQSVFQSGAPSLHFHQKWVRVPVAVHSRQHLVFSVLNFSHSGGHKLVSHCDFHLHFPVD